MTVAALLLVPVLIHAESVRLVSDTDVTWIHDGETLGSSNETAPLTLDLPAGRHELWALGPDDQDWQALVRPEPQGINVAYVDAWVAKHEAPEPPRSALPWAPMGLLALAVAIGWPSKNP